MSLPTSSELRAAAIETSDILCAARKLTQQLATSDPLEVRPLVARFNADFASFINSRNYKCSIGELAQFRDRVDYLTSISGI